MRTIYLLLASTFFFFFFTNCKSTKPIATQPVVVAKDTTLPPPKPIPFTKKIAKEYNIDFSKLVSTPTKPGAQFISGSHVIGRRGIENKSSKVESGKIKLQVAVLDSFEVMKNLSGVCFKAIQNISADTVGGVITRDTFYTLEIGYWDDSSFLTYGPDDDQDGTYILYGNSDGLVPYNKKDYEVGEGPFTLLFLPEQVIIGGMGNRAPGRKIIKN